ncbi:DNA-directed DNA polymerase [Malassezia japonica]|uniref:DNA polymerase epsilon subunit D n=1 Tax=Malassezia japonica TaxID=223818 RepID=A0AAF0FAE0_9BASI|nr:DNA-directed DNA polymerase [Malassezia japonica]WFD41242.1 DNA-directed DNA polymerase [Malassezia japonica]
MADVATLLSSAPPEEEVERTEEAAEESAREDLYLTAKTMTATNAAGGTFGLGIDQYELPKASISKLARSEIPESVQLRKDTLSALVKSSSVFVSYLTAASHDVAIARGNKTISAAHVLDALRELEFPASMRKELREQLEAYRDLQKKSAAARADAAARNRAAAKARAATEKAEGGAAADTTMEADEMIDKTDDAEEGDVSVDVASTQAMDMDAAQS